MLYAVVADIHSNFHALSAVLEDMEDAGVDRVLCLGDIVGYAAHPAECLKAIREIDAVAVAGNHDWGVLGKIDVSYFNADAADALEWTRQRLTADNLKYLESLPLVQTVDDVTLVHSTLFSPDYFDYIQTLYDVRLAFNYLQTRLCFVGHSHIPVMFQDTTPVQCFLAPELTLVPGQRFIVNVGSVGQPRDLDARACYALYNSAEGKVYLRRVEYDVQSAAQSILDAGLPATNGARLLLGR